LSCLLAGVQIGGYGSNHDAQWIGIAGSQFNAFAMPRPVKFAPEHSIPPRTRQAALVEYAKELALASSDDLQSDRRFSVSH
jgi:hypothetical protein